MDEILYLEPDEEITGVIDKVKKTHTDSIGLVIPRNSTLIHSIVNLKLLKKEAEQNKKEIALVTTDKVGKNIAAQVGLAVYEDVHAKRPVQAFSARDLPTTDDVIEVDMSGGHVSAEDDDKKAGEAPKIKRYDSDAAPVKKAEKPAPKKIVEEEIIDPAHDDLESADTFNEPAGEEMMVLPTSKEVAFQRREVVDIDDADEGVVAAAASEPVSHRHEKEYVRRETKTRTASGSKKGLIVAIAIFLVVVLATLLGLPQSSVVVTVAAEGFEKTTPLVINKEAKESDIETGTVPGKMIEVTNSDAQRVPATGKKDVGGKAKGSVVISNAWDGSPLTYNAGTIITSTEGKSFQLNDKITVPGATASLVQGTLVTTPGKATANVTATESGESYNVKAGKFTITGVPDDRSSKIYAESSKDFTGGSSKVVTVMTQEDIDNAKTELAKSLTTSALDELKKQAKGSRLFEDAVVSDVQESTTNPSAVGSETDYFDIKVKAKHQVMVFDEKAANDLIAQTIKKDVPTDKELITSENDESSLSLDKADYNNGKLMLTSRVKTKVGTRVDVKQASQGLAGKNKDQIRDKVSSIPNFKDVTVTTFPNWWWQDTSFFSWNNRFTVLYE